MAPPPWRKIHAHFALSSASLFQFLYQFLCQLDGKWTKNMKPFSPFLLTLPPNGMNEGKNRRKKVECVFRRERTVNGTTRFFNKTFFAFSFRPFFSTGK
jgi:hypothetical protein